MRIQGYQGVSGMGWMISQYMSYQPVRVLSARTRTISQGTYYQTGHVLSARARPGYGDT